MFSHEKVGNKSLGESVVGFALTGDLSSPSIILFNINISFSTDGENICLPIAEVLFCLAARDLARSQKQRNWTSRNAVFLLPFLMEAAILHGESDAGKLLNIFFCSITEWELNTDSLSEANNDNSVVTIEAAEAKNPGKTKQASLETATTETKKR